MGDKWSESSPESFEGVSGNEEAGGSGSLKVSQVERMRDLRRNGFSYREIADFMFCSVSTVYKWTHTVMVEVFLETGSLSEKLTRYFGHPIEWPPPNESKLSKSSQAATAASEPTMAPPPNDSQRAVSRTQVFNGTLYVTRTRLGILPFSVPEGVLRPATISFTAAGLPFDVHLLFSNTQLNNFGKPYTAPTVYWSGTEDYYRPYMWKSPGLVTSISERLPMNRAGQWYLVFRNAPELTESNSIKVSAELTTERRVSG